MLKTKSWQTKVFFLTIEQNLQIQGDNFYSKAGKKLKS